MSQKKKTVTITPHNIQANHSVEESVLEFTEWRKNKLVTVKVVADEYTLTSLAEQINELVAKKRRLLNMVRDALVTEAEVKP